MTVFLEQRFKNPYRSFCQEGGHDDRGEKSVEAKVYGYQV